MFGQQGVNRIVYLGEAAVGVGLVPVNCYRVILPVDFAVAIAGVLFAAKGAIEPAVGLLFGIKAFAAAIVGGFGSMPGAIIGGLLVGIVEQFAGLYLPPGFADTSAYVLLLVMLLVRPQGLFATMQKKKV